MPEENYSINSCAPDIYFDDSKIKISYDGTPSWVDENETSSGEETGNSNGSGAPIVPDLDISDDDMNCADILGPNGVKVVKLGINILRVAGAIIALVNAMLSLLPAVMSKDADALKKAGSKCVSMAIILALIFLFPTLLKIIGKMFEWDVSCLM